MSILLTWIANSLAICIVAYFLKGVSVGSLRDAFLAGALLSLINATVRPVLVILTLPLTVVSLGLFYFVVTAFCLWLTAYFVPGFAVTDFLSTVVASILVSLFSTLIHRILANGPEVVRLDAAASHHRHVPRADPRGRDAGAEGRTPAGSAGELAARRARHRSRRRDPPARL